MFTSGKKGTTCDQCGYELRKDYDRIPTCGRCQSPPKKCKHLGLPIGEPVKVLCDTCQGRVHIKHQGHQCAVNGRCLPKYRPNDLTEWQERKPESDIYALCHGCEKREYE